MTLNRSIGSCTNMDQLSNLRESVLAYHKGEGQDSGELLANFKIREGELSPETITIYAKSPGQINSTVYRLLGRTLTSVWCGGSTCSIEINSDYDSRLEDRTYYIPASKSEFDSELKRAYNLITMEL